MSFYSDLLNQAIKSIKGEEKSKAVQMRKNINILILLKVATCRNFWEGGINERRNSVVG